MPSSSSARDRGDGGLVVVGAVATGQGDGGEQPGLLDFAEYDGSRSLEEFARQAARPAHPRVADVTRDELVEIVRRVLAADPEGDYYLLLLEANVLRPEVTGLVLHPPPHLQDASAEETVDKALKYRPIAL